MQACSRLFDEDWSVFLKTHRERAGDAIKLIQT
jgi:hypothetical protein